MMPSEGPEDDSHKVIIELDYGHFVTLHGWLYLAQVVRYCYFFFIKNCIKVRKKIFFGKTANENNFFGLFTNSI